MITICSVGIDNHTNVAHVFLGKKQDSLKAQHNDASLCDCVNFRDVGLLVGCVAIGIDETVRKFRSVRGIKCKQCREVLKEIQLNFH